MSRVAWRPTGDRRVWVAAVGDLLLTVTHTTSGQWVAAITSPFTDDRSPELATRIIAQRWAEVRAGGAR